jgi:short subunit dehydrogenase-like uncharacterized protein
MLGECALGLALQYDDLPPLAKQGGVLTPATAMGDVLVKRLEESETFKIESFILGREGQARKSA